MLSITSPNFPIVWYLPVSVCVMFVEITSGRDLIIAREEVGKLTL